MGTIAPTAFCLESAYLDSLKYSRPPGGVLPNGAWMCGIGTGVMFRYAGDRITPLGCTGPFSI